MHSCVERAPMLSLQRAVRAAAAGSTAGRLHESLVDGALPPWNRKLRRFQTLQHRRQRVQRHPTQLACASDPLAEQAQPEAEPLQGRELRPEARPH